MSLPFRTPRARRAALLGAALLVGAVGYAQFRDYRSAQAEAFSTPAGKAFLETYAALRQTYLRDVKPETLLQGALSGMLESLEDEFTYYLPPEVSATDNEDLRGEFFGIGVGILPANKDGTGVKVETVYRAQPAARAGLQAGDVIRTVDGKSVGELTSTQAVRLIRGKQGSTVTLGVRRGANDLEFKVVRDKINLVNVSTAVLPGNVGYVGLSDFANQKVEAQLQAALRDLKAKNVKGLVLDLRNNPGGLVNQAEAVADAFLGKGDVFITRDKKGKVSVEYAARPSGTDYTGPLVVLVNDSSASASEIVAAALQENGRAKVVGEKTFGKGVANIPTPLSNGAQVNIAFEEWLTPKRNSIFKKGVTPDVAVEDTRFPAPLSLEGLNAPAGSEVTLTVGGQTLKLKADAEGKFSYQAEPGRVQTSDRQGTALVDLAKDAQLKRALEVLSSTAKR